MFFFLLGLSKEELFSVAAISAIIAAKSTEAITTVTTITIASVRAFFDLLLKLLNFLLLVLSKSLQFSCGLFS